MYLSEQVDEEFEANEAATLSTKRDEMKEYEEECSFIFGDDERGEHEIDEDAADVSVSSFSVNRSGLARVTCVGVNACTQTDVFCDRPPICHIRNCTEEIKKTCVEVSVKCGISVQSAVGTVQTVCKSLYNHQYFATKAEAIERDPSLANYKSDELSGPEEKRPRLESDERVTLPPTKKDEYIPHKHVLPSARVLTEYKQRMAIQAESEAAIALYNKPGEVKCTLHYDTTSRCKIDGEWPAIILNFAGKERFSLRLLFFAYEDRQQIVSLFVETFERLTALVTPKEAGQEVTAKELWEKVTVIMTDSVEKNLKIDNGIASELKSNHIPLHLLCKAHTVEALDRLNLNVLGNVEEKLKFRDALISTAPSIKPFLRGEKSVSVAAIKTIINFVSHDKSATSSNQASLFDHILEREDKVKHISLYQERRFTKLGYSCTSILDAFPYIRMVINETHLNNQHVDIIKILLDSEFLLSELSALAYFTYKVTLPLLNAVEVATQDELCKIFPQLYKDLQNGSLDTLIPYMVKYRHIDLKEPTSEVEISLLQEMCYDAAKTIERQCGREYGFGICTDMKQRATEIHKLSEEEKKDLEKHNVICERELGVFDHRSHVSKTRNNKFKAKSLRNDMVLHKATFDIATKLSTTVLKLLNKREVKWEMQQKDLHRKKIEEMMKQVRNSSEYTNKLLQRCKSWGGPVTSVEELTTILESKPDVSEHVIRTELAYYRDTHKSDVIANPSLFKLNKISSEDRLSNFVVLLNGHSNKTTPLPIPRNTDALKILKKLEPFIDTEDKLVYVNQICVALWLTTAGKKVWYLGYCQEVLKDGKFVVEHLWRVKESSDLKWKYPEKSDIATVDADQIMSCEITGDWDVHADRNMTYTLRNHVLIRNKFLELK